MTEQELNNHFAGFRIHHFLIGFPIGILLADGIDNGNPTEWILAILLFIGFIFQSIYFYVGMKKIVSFLKD